MPTASSSQPEVSMTNAAIDSSPADAPAGSSSSSGTSGAWGWLFWLAGTGVALILGLFLFGRRIKERFGAPGATTPVEVERRSNTAADVDFDFDDTINAEAISLDADLGAGTGLDSGAQVDVAEDFGFSADNETEGDLDLELTENAAREPEVSPTDIIAPNHREEAPTILDSEEPPIEDDEYDLSMIVDATKQPLDEFDATAKDLQAVQIDPTDSITDDSDYTLSSAADFEALEQDYQDEFTATQVANAELEKVAKELANRMDEDDAFDVTREMPVGESTTDDVSETDLTVELPDAETSDESAGLRLPTVSDSAVTAELTANLPTSIEAENDPDIDAEELDVTMEMSAGSDVTVDMKIQSGKVDTKKK